MHTHRNARLTAVSRERPVLRHNQDAAPLADLADQAGISLRTAYKWLARYRSGGRCLGGSTHRINDCGSAQTLAYAELACGGDLLKRVLEVQTSGQIVLHSLPR